MIVQEAVEIEKPAPEPVGMSFGETTRLIFAWPILVKVYLLGLMALYAPLLFSLVKVWISDENQSHGIFVPPVILFLLWLQRDELAKTPSKPTIWGLPLLVAGLAIEMLLWLLRVEAPFLVVWSFIFTLTGSILILHGLELWKRLQFPTLFFAMAGGIPGKILFPISTQLQNISSIGAEFIMKTLGFAVMRTGNILEVPGAQLEVAEACSGIKKFVALLAFSLVYGYLFKIGLGRRILLFIATVPIAVFANVIRVAGLVAVTYWGGTNALHIAHDWAEVIVLVISFVIFVYLGKLLGCKTLRFSL